MTAFVVDAAMIAFATSNGDAEGLVSRYNAAAPVTWGEAIDVPLAFTNEASSAFHADQIALPGA